MAVIAFAQNFEYRGLNYSITNVTTNECTVTGPVDPAITELDIPAEAIYIRKNANGADEQVKCPVTAIGYNAFNNKDLLKRVTMSDNIVYIGRGAFQGCDLLEEIHLSDNIETIGNSGLCACPRLTRITLPKELKTLGYSALSNNASLREIKINDKLQTIESYALNGNPGIRELEFPATLETVQQDGISGNENLKKVTFHGAVKVLDHRAFYKCYNLKEVHVPDLECWLGMGFQSTDSNPLSYAHNLYINGTKVSEVVIPGTVETVPAFCFAEADIEHVKLEDGVKVIGDRAFVSSQGLKSIDFGNTLEIIGPSAFSSCAKLESLTFPKTLKKLHNYVFERCSSIRTIYWEGHIDEIGEYDFGYLDSLEEVVISDLSAWCSQKFPLADNSNPLKYAKTLTIGGKRLHDLIIPDDVENVGQAIFYGATELRSVTIPDHVKSIGSYAFFGCSGIQSVSIGKSVSSVSLGDSFYGCSSTRTLRFENGVEPIVVEQAAWWSEMGALNNLYIGREIITSSNFPSKVRLLEIGPDVTDTGDLKNDRYTGLKYIQTFASEPPCTVEFSENQYNTVKILVPEGCGEKYRTADVWKNFADISESAPIDFEKGTVSFDAESYAVPKDSVLYVTLNIGPAPLTAEDMVFSCSSYKMTVTPVKGNTVAIKGGSGTMTVTATNPYSGESATATVEVLPVPRKISINPTNVTVTVGESVPVEVTITPENAYPSEYEWYNMADCEKYISFENNIITGLSEGKCKIRIRVKTSKSGYEYASCNVTVNKNSGIEDLTNDPENEPVEYFNLQGIPVSNPTNGMYIRRQGTNSTKVILP